jgi:hypothetical protein
MPIYEVNIPGKGTFDVKSRRPLSEDEAIQAVMAQLAPPAPVEPEATPESGFIPALKAGASELKAGLTALGARTGLLDEAEAAKSIAESEQYQRETFRPTEEGWLEAPGTKIAELLGGSLPYIAAPIAAAGAVAAAPITGTAATIAGLGAAGAASATQFTGSNLRRQMETGKSIGETDLGNAALAAVPQAALDLVSFRMMPAIRRLFGAAGKEISEEAAKQIANKSIKDAAADYALTTGKVMGVEGLTETSQQVLERMQAGLDLTDAEARDEYFQSFVGGAVLGGVLAPPGRYLERRGIIAEEEKKEREAKAEAARAKKEEEMAAEEQEIAAGAQAPLLSAEEAVSGEVAGAFSQFDAAEREEQKNALAEEVQSEYQTLIRQAEDLQSEAASAAQRGDAPAANAAANRLEMVEGAIKSLETRTKNKQDDLFGVKLQKPEKRVEDADLETPLRDRIGKAKKKLEKAGDLGDFKKIQAASAELADLKAQLAEMKQQGDLFGATNIRGIEKAEAEIAEAEAKAKELSDKRTLYTALMSMQATRDERLERRKTEEEQSADIAQERATRRLEFGLERMPLAPLGFSGDVRGEEEAKIKKGIVSPAMAKALGIANVNEDSRAVDMLDALEDAYNRDLQVQQKNATNLLSAENQLFDAEGRLTPYGTNAVVNEARLRAIGRLRDMARESRDVLEGQRRLDEAEQTLAEEVSGAGQFKRATQKLTEKTQSQKVREEISAVEDQLERVNAQIAKPEGKTPEQIQDLELQARELRAGLVRLERQLEPLTEQDLKTKESALDTFTSSIYDLQRGQFLGARPGRPEIAESEAKRNAELRKKIEDAEKELAKVKEQLKTPAAIQNQQRNASLARRQSSLEGKIKTFKAGLSAQPEKGRTTFKMLQDRADKSILEYVNSAINEVNAARVVAGKNQLSESEEKNLRGQLNSYMQEVLGRASAAERVSEQEVIGTFKDKEGKVSELKARKQVDQKRAAFEKLKVAINVLKNNLDATIAEAKGEKPEAELPVETQAPPKKTEIKRGTSKVLDMVDRIKELEAARERAKPEELSVDILQAEVDRLTELVQLVKDVRKVPPAKREEAGFGEEQLRAIPYVTNPQANAKLLQDLRGVKKVLADAKKIQAQQQSVFDSINKEIDSLEERVAKTIQDAKKAAEAAKGPTDTIQNNIERNVEILFNIKKEIAKLNYTLPLFGSQRARVEKSLKERNTREGRAELMKKLKEIKEADAKVRARIELLKTIDKDNAAMLKRFGVEAKADQVVEVAIPNYSGTGSIIVEQPIGIRLEPYGKLRGQRILNAIESEERATEIIGAADDAIARASIVKSVEKAVEFFKKIASEQEAMLNKLNAAMQKAKTKKAKANYQRLIDRGTTNLSKTLEQLDLSKKSLGVTKTGGFGEIKVERAPRFNFDQIQLAKKALEERIVATQARLKELPPIERTFENVLRDARIGAIKTPEGKLLPKTEVTVRYERMPRARDPEVIKAEKIAAAEEGALAEAAARENYEKVKNDPAASKEEKTSARMAILRAAKIKNSVKEFEFVDVPVMEKRFVDPNVAETIANTERRVVEERLQRKGIESLKSATDSVEAAREEVIETRKAYDSYVAAGNKIKATEAKAAHLRAKKLFDAARMTKVRIEEKVKELEGKAEEKVSKSKKHAGADIYLDLDEVLDEEAQSVIKQQIQGKNDIDWRVGSEVTEIINPADVTARLDDIKKKADKRGIKFEYYDNFDKVPMKALRQLARQGMDIYADRIRGGVMPDGTVFVIVDHHNDIIDIERTIAHELIGHYTTDSLLGKKGLDDLMSRVDKTMATKENESGLENLAVKLGLTDEYNDALAATYQFYKTQLAEGKITEKEVARIAKTKGLREIIAYTTEQRVTPSFMEKAAIWLKELVGAVRKALRELGLEMNFSTSDLFYLIKESEQAFLSGKEIPYMAADGGISLATSKPRWAAATDSTVIEAVDDLIAPPTTVWERIKANVLGLNFRTQFLDRAAALEEIKRRGLETGQLDAVKAVDLVYFLRNYDQKMSYVAEAATNGVVQLREVKRPDGLVEHELARDMQKDAASLQKVAAALQDAGYGDAKANGDFFTAYMAAERALAVGAEKAGGKTSAAKYDALRKEGRKNEAIQEARRLYNEYNHDLITLLEQSGSIDKQKANELRAKKDYVPYYVQDSGGMVNLMVDGEKITRVGSILEQPELKELVGSDQKIRDFFTTSLQNTHMVMDMALRNLATRNVGFVLQGLGLAKRVSSKASGDKYIHARVKGEDVTWEITTEGSDTFGDIPAEIIVKGLNGVKTQLPGVMQIFSIPSDIFRKFITRDPAYAIRQIFRDSTAAWMAGGSDAKPVLSSLAEMTKILRGKSAEEKQLLARGVGGGQVITGTPEDMSKIMMQIASGKPGWHTLLAKMDSFAIAGDVATRVQAYKSFLRQGMSEREAALASLEIMNFSRRGISPSVQYLNAMIPFFSANVQGIDVLYRAFAKKMPFEERQSIQAKLIKRGAMVAALTALYAIAMDDDETYENATAEQRYSNWFVPLPFVDGMFRVPIPFELGFIFKALPEAVVRSAMSDDSGKEIIGDMAKMLMRSVPGDIPLTLKPAIEVMANYSFYSQSPILSARMAQLDTTLQVGKNTPDVLAMLGSLGISPIKAEALFRGYTGSLGLGLLGMTNFAFPDAPGKADVIDATMRAVDFPVFGRMIQPIDGNNMINKGYDAVDDAQRVRNTFNEYIRQGLREEAKSYLKANLETLATASFAGVYTRTMGELSKLERMIRMTDNLDPKQKREKLDKIRQHKINLANQFAAFKREGKERQAAAA